MPGHKRSDKIKDNDRQEESGVKSVGSGEVDHTINDFHNRKSIINYLRLLWQYKNADREEVTTYKSDRDSDISYED